MVAPHDRPILLYDGTCGFCASSVQFVLNRERLSRSLLFATLDGEVGRNIRAAFPETAGVDSIILYKPQSASGAARVMVRSDAALWVASYLGGTWRTLSIMGRLFPRVLRDAVYRFIATHRHKIAGAESCLVPRPEERARFLD